MGHAILVMEILGAYHVVVGHNALDYRHDALATEVGGEFLEVIFEVGRRGGEDERVIGLGNGIDVARKVDFVDIEVSTSQVGRVVPLALEIGDAVVASHIPAYVVGVFYHHFGNGSGP